MSLTAKDFIPSHDDRYGVSGTAWCPQCKQVTVGRIPHSALETYHCSACCRRHYLPFDANGEVFVKHGT